MLTMRVMCEDVRLLIKYIFIKYILNVNAAVDVSINILAVTDGYFVSTDFWPC